MLLVEETFEKYNYHIEDFSEFSSKMVIVQCDYCLDKIEKPISNFNIQRKKSDKDSCSKKECKGKKISETKIKQIGTPFGFRKCSECHEVKELNESNFHKGGKLGFKYMCKDCQKNKYENTKVLVVDTQIPLKEAISFYNISMENTQELLPYSFFSRIDNLKGFLDYLFKEKTNVYNNKFINFNMEFVKKYKLNSLFTKFNSIYEMINEFYPNYIKPWQLKKTSQGIWNDDQNVKDALTWLVETLLNENIISDISELPNVCTYELFEKYSLGGLISKKFNYSPFKAISFIFPNKFKRWEFNLPHNYYESKQNRIEIMTEFINELLNDSIIKSIDDVPQNVDINMFEKYNLRSFLQYVYHGVSFQAFDELYPNRWKIWEFNSCPAGFWDKSENLFECIDWLIEKLFSDKLIRSIEELPSVFGSKICSEYNVARLYNHREKVIPYIVNKYFNKLDADSFNLCIANDGTKCLSKQEVTIHNLFLHNQTNAKYCTKTTLFYNTVENERYSPDWIVNGNIIIEYFGLYVENHYERSLFKNYRDKTKRKIEYYTSLNDYQFIGLYPKDLSHGFKGLIKKFKDYGIDLVI